MLVCMDRVVLCFVSSLASETCGQLLHLVASRLRCRPFARHVGDFLMFLSSGGRVIM